MELPEMKFDMTPLTRKRLITATTLLGSLLMIVIWVTLVISIVKALDDGPAHRPSEWQHRR